MNFAKEIHMKYRSIPGRDQDGLVTVAALLFLIILTITATSGVSTSNMEVKIATNDEIHKMTFYAADGGADFGTELVELNIACPTGFANDNLTIGDNNNINIIDKDFWLQTASDGQPDIRIDDASGNLTNLSISGQAGFGIGGAIEMAAAYEGKGKAAASGGITLDYEIESQHLGYANSESVVAVNWQHVVGSEGTCLY
jgi:hypothetical protein